MVYLKARHQPVGEHNAEGGWGQALLTAIRELKVKIEAADAANDTAKLNSNIDWIDMYRITSALTAFEAVLGVELVADPNIGENCHHLTACGDFGALHIKVENRPLAENPKSSELAALSLVRLIENRCRSICV